MRLEYYKYSAVIFVSRIIPCAKHIGIYEATWDLTLADNDTQASETKFIT